MNPGGLCPTGLVAGDSKDPLRVLFKVVGSWPCRTWSSRGSIAPSASPSWSGRSTSRARSDQRHRPEPGAPRLPVHGRPRRRQDQRGAHPGQGAVLREGPDRRTLRRVRHLPGDRGRAFGRRHRDRRRLQHRGRGRPSPCCEGVRYLPAQGPTKVYIIDEVHMLVDAGVQRAAEDAGGAAAARRVHVRDDRGPQDPGHDPVALPALRLQADPHGAADRRTSRRSSRPRRSRPRPRRSA